MFRCQVTGKLSKPGEKCHKIVVEKRQKVYTVKMFNELTGKFEDFEVGRGWETVKEINATEAGLAVWNAQENK